MPININFETNLTRQEADALRALLDSLHPASGGVVADVYPTYIGEQWVGKKFTMPATTDDEEPEVFVGEPSVTVTIPTAENPEDFPQQASPIVDIDSDGKEWDEAIHASTRTKTADGRWKKKRGTGGGAVTTDTVVQETEGVEQFTPSTPDTPAVTVSVPTPPAAAPVPPPAPTDSGVPSFPDAVKICSALGKETYTKLFAEVGLKSVMEMRDDAALRERFFGHESVIVARMEKGV